MRKPLLILALAGGVLDSGELRGQETISPWKVEGLRDDSVIKYDLNSGKIRASNGVRIKYKPGAIDAAELVANSATVNQKTGKALALGNITLRRDGMVWKSERIEYNFRSKEIMSAQFRSGTLSAFIQGSSLSSSKTNGVYRAQNTLFTTDDTKNPDFYITAKDVEVLPGEYVLFRGATLYVGKVPIFYLPYYKRSLKRHPWNY